MKVTEIERKFLVNKDYQKDLMKEPGTFLRQGYLSTDPTKTVRIRIKDNEAFLTVKGLTTGISRTEIESPIALEAAQALFDSFISNEIQKIRRNINVGGKYWEVDEFLGQHAGLWIAEIELEHVEEDFEKPQWLGREVSTEREYFNSYLSEHGLKGVALE